MSDDRLSEPGSMIIVEPEQHLAARIAERVSNPSIIVHSMHDLRRQPLDQHATALIAHWLPDARGIEALEYVHTVRPDMVCLLTGPSIDEDIRSDALQHGASDVVPTSDAGIELLPWIVETASLRASMRAEQERRARQVAHSLTHMNRICGDLRREVDELERLARTDELTGLCNRRRVRELLQRSWERAMQDSRELGLLMIDLDGFKAFNDTFGHPEGDELLRIVSSVLIKGCRQNDMPARLGGDEFAVMLPRTPWVECAAVAARLRNALESELGARSQGLNLSASIGLAHMELSQPASMESFIKHADEALYAAKRAGKARVMIRSEGGIFAPTQCR